MKITGHTLVKNEENFVWFAINSVIDYLDELMVWDTGSSDNTVPIIQLFNNPKIKFREIGTVDNKGLAEARQRMLDETPTTDSGQDWIFVLDGDEVWHESAIKDLRFRIYELEDKKDLVVSPNCMLVGDMFHYQEERAGRYRIAGRMGHYNVRAIRMTEGLKVTGVYPNEAYVNGDGVKVQDLPDERILFLDEAYLHASYLKRSGKDNKKLKHEIGESYARGFYYPEVFFRDRPSVVPSPWVLPDFDYKFRAFWETPLKKIKRRIK